MRWLRLSVFVLMLPVLAACDVLGPGSLRPEAVTATGNEQIAAAGAELIMPLRVAVTGDRDRPVSGIEVRWSVTDGGGQLSDTTVVTDVDGLAEVRWTLGPEPGQNGASAIVAGLPAVVFSAVGRDIPAAVQAVYLVPADREVREDYLAAIEHGMEHLRAWYQQAMGNSTTFRLHDPPVTVIESEQPVEWFQSRPYEGPAQHHGVIPRAKTETRNHLGRPKDRVLLVFVDAKRLCGQPGAMAFFTLAVVDGTILRLLATGELINPCHGEEPFEVDPCQAVGGAGHELGHLFRLPHTCQRWPQPSCQQSIMDVGWIRYPNSILVEEERVELAAGSFFALDEPLELTACSAT